MFVDNDLNDISEKIVKKQSNEKSYLLGIIVGLSFLLITVIIIAIVNDYMGYKSHKEHNKEVSLLKEEIEDLNDLVSEQTLLYSIGLYTLEQQDTPLNDASLLWVLEKCEAWYPQILIAQAKLETGNYTSELCTNNHNLFGMKSVRKRSNTQTGVTNSGYGTYNNWQLSVIDRILWDIYYFDNEKPSEEEYLKAMSKYAEDPNYIKKIKSKL